MSKLYVNEVHSKTGSTKALEIDSDGRILTPARPSFLAHAIGSADITTSGNYFVLTDVRHNIGNHYNSSTGIFTAPVAGIYLFTLQCMGNNGGGRAMLGLHKNNSNVAFGSADTEEYNDCSIIVNLQLEANDTVRMYAQTGNWYAGQSDECWFGGYLIG